MNIIQTVNFGSSKGGLSTVGYRLLNTDGSVKQVRTTTGVFEVVASTGLYACYISFDNDWQGIIVWDTGDTPLLYAVEEYRYQQTESFMDVWEQLVASHLTAGSMGEKMAKMPVPFDVSP